MRVHLTRATLATLAVLASIAGPSAHADPAPRTLAVVVAKGAKVTTISRADVRRAFSGDSVVVSGVRLVPFNYAPSTTERVAFDRVILGMDAEQVGRYWVDRKIRGQNPAPRSLAQASHMLKVVAKFPGALGYIPADQVPADLTVVAIDGLRPGDRGYPLVSN